MDQSWHTEEAEEIQKRVQRERRQVVLEDALLQEFKPCLEHCSLHVQERMIKDGSACTVSTTSGWQECYATQRIQGPCSCHQSQSSCHALRCR